MAANIDSAILRALIAQSEYNVEMMRLIGELAARLEINDDDKEFVDAVKGVQLKAHNYVEAIDTAIKALSEGKSG